MRTQLLRAVLSRRPEDEENGRATRTAKWASPTGSGRSPKLAHWNEYLDWAKDRRGIVAADSRLPPEREPGEDDDVPVSW